TTGGVDPAGILEGARLPRVGPRGQMDTAHHPAGSHSRGPVVHQSDRGRPKRTSLLAELVQTVLVTGTFSVPVFSLVAGLDPVATSVAGRGVVGLSGHR